MIESSAGTNIMAERFTEALRAASEPGWSHAVGHRFVNELVAGAMPDAVMARYLIQDHRFLDSFLTLLGAVLASADTFAARLRLGRFIGMMSGEKNTYFLRAFEALGVPEVRRAADPDTQATAGFKAIMREAADTRGHAAALSALVVAEWLYLDWASRAPKPPRTTLCTPKWITLHENLVVQIKRLVPGLEAPSRPFSATQPSRRERLFLPRSSHLECREAEVEPHGGTRDRLPISVRRSTTELKRPDS
jgi:thiaminase/transcriptional activator TenA